MPTGRFASTLNQASTDQVDFLQLYEENVERLYRYYLARTGNVQDAQDLTAETFRAALESFSSYRPARSPAVAWLMGIARHKLVDHLRRNRQMLAWEQVEGNPDGGPCPEEVAGRRLQMAQVAAALSRLPADRAEAISLHFFAGLSLAEAAEVMGKGEEAVKKIIQRGLGDLRARLNRETEGMR